eukprot:SAG11_NODE_12752_length_687_cov_0.826531_2_plen_169_part_01
MTSTLQTGQGVAPVPVRVLVKRRPEAVSWPAGAAAAMGLGAPSPVATGAVPPGCSCSALLEGQTALVMATMASTVATTALNIGFCFQSGCAFVRTASMAVTLVETALTMSLHVPHCNRRANTSAKLMFRTRSLAPCPSAPGQMLACNCNNRATHRLVHDGGEVRDELHV